MEEKVDIVALGELLIDLPEHRRDSVQTVFSHPDYVLLP